MSSSNSRNMDALGRDDGDSAASNDLLEQKKSFLREMIEIDEEARAKGTVVSSPLSDEEKGPHIIDGQDD